MRTAAALTVLAVPSTMLSGSLAMAFAVPGDDTSTPTTTTASASRHNQVVGSLTLDPDHGKPGTKVTATATDFSPCLRLAQLLWDGHILDSTKFTIVDIGSGTIALSFAVPADATADGHSVQAVCARGNDSDTNGRITLTTTPPATFTVDPVAQPTFTLTPGQGLPGAQVTASGAGFACDTDLALRWDDGSVLADQLPGTFTTHVSVPADASVDSPHSITASCRDDPDIAVSQPFTVTPAALSTTVTTGVSQVVTGVTVTPQPRATPAEPITPDTTSAGPPWWLITLIMLIAAVALTGAAYCYRRSHPRPAHVGAEVRAVPHFDTAPTVTVSETPAPGEVARSIGLVPHPDPGTQTFVEVSP